MACGDELPEVIIQHIQSHLLEKDAARTSLLSKSWHCAWFTRPNLSFSPVQFRNRMNEFERFTKKTMQRYEDSNLQLKSFSLWMVGNHNSLAKKLILKAIQLGATDLEIEIWSFILPDEVLESKTLTRLSLTGVCIDLERREKEVTCSNLKSLYLKKVTVKGNLFRDLISSCQIEEVKWDGYQYKGRLEEFHHLKLKYLRLKDLNVKDALYLYSHDLCPKFPCLKELVISDYFSDNVRIRSPSLKRLTIRVLHNRIWDGEFDVPNIRKLKVSSCDVPRLEIKTSSREWESDIDIHSYGISASWFARLSQLVRTLSLSRVSLCLSVEEEVGLFYGYVGVGDRLPIPRVENLRLYDWKVTPQYLDSLFWSGCPNVVKVEKHLVFCIAKEDMEGWKALLDDQQGYACFQLN